MYNLTHITNIPANIPATFPASQLSHPKGRPAAPAVPQGFAVFGADETVRKLVPAPPGAHWTEFPHGKHFPALEAPADLQSFFAPLS